MCWKSTGTPKTGAWVYLAWLAWLGTTLWVFRQTLQGALDGGASYYMMLGLAGVAGLLSVPLLNRVSVVNLLILVPVWLFGAWYSLSSMTLPYYWLFAPLICYAGALIGGGLVIGVWEWAQKRNATPPAEGLGQEGITDSRQDGE